MNGNRNRKRTHSGDGSIRRREAADMETLIGEMIRELKLASGLNERRVFAAWDEVSGAGMHTINRYFRNGVLYCTMSSSMVRTHILMQKDLILKAMNDRLLADEMYVREPGGGESVPVKNIVLR